ncbi:SLBB domain-containing protein [Vibrio gazogenes]|uniref:Protein involved in polysaccharide export, contains SLBB domain of the beta-grasp fold n=1 Tax=Vibrio gazogenes DSM 21264 = NBRC 103151 TaxID=1123492 RepID=A0A1M5D1G9_VIBGA|nr:SLBB domain-containing protein [Vibrio gazogenes]USP13914.1 SLBB domain-containing protein [Vibrio gazogenes]SHF60675.1 protein involved in polysaccharide export, contains SLBB domain of the beta-grasp fold [Vibrio gazogenes DSM 21264] [Vibrio gazogenes DSM 21264 = NBRC 103151]SJN56646.1 Polysialic acid transport protein KpsD precursor [Vibrio gazogenes]
MRYILFRLIIVFFVSLSSFSSWSANFTASQIAQFKQLSPAQQQALAQQYGVELSTLMGSDKAVDIPRPVQTIEPRDVDKQQKTAKAGEGDAAKQLVNFGYDLFSGQPSSYTPVDDLPVPNNYLIAAGDEINVQLFGSQNNSYSLNVSRDGSIQFPNLGPIHVAGQTFSELKANLTERIKKQILGIDVAISLGSLRIMQVYVTGDVYQPGAYNIPSLATVTQALIAAGGFSKSGSLRNVTVRRENKVIAQLDLYNLLLQGNNLSDIRLQSGDTVFVAAKGPSVSIRGEIRRPAVYEIKSGTTIKQLLKLAGGSKASAYLPQLQVKRYQNDGIHIHTLDLTKDKDKLFVLQDGDDITVKPTSDVLKNAVIVRGAAIRQGAYSYSQGMRVSDLFSSSDDLAPNADLDYAIIVRETGHKHNIKVLQFSLNNAINLTNSSDNLVLHSNDQLFVFATDISLDEWKTESVKQQPATSGDLFTHSEKSMKEHSKKRDALTGVELVDSEKPKLAEQGSDKDLQEMQNSRLQLLKPLINRLQLQAVNGERAKIYEISGAVRYPGVYPLVEGGSLKEAIAAAGGLLESAAKDEAELSRVVPMPGTIAIHHQTFDLIKALTNPNDNFLLESKDRIVVQRKTNWKTNNIVEIQGEVMHPGSYTINQGETIHDLVKRAGGLSQFAYPQGAVFSREVLRLQEQQRMKMVTNSLRQEIASLTLRRQSSAATYTSSPTEAMKVVDDLLDIPAIGRLVIDLPNILLGNAQDDVMLEDGDKLYIPPRRNTISVLGQVQIASNFTFKPGLSVEKYISLAGGEKKQADTDRVYVIRANGAVMLPNQSHWFVRSEKSLAPGDTIVVPIDTDYLDGLSTFSTATQMMYQIGVAWNAIK